MIRRVTGDCSPFAHRVARFEQNKKLAYFAVNRFFPLLPWNDKEDVISIAFYGLWKATRSYNPASGYAFSTYAMQAMKSQFIRYGLFAAEKRRQGFGTGEGNDAPRLVSLNAGEDEATLLDTLVAGSESDPLAALLLAEEVAEKVEQARIRWEKMPRSIKIRYGVDAHDSAAILFGEEHRFVPTEEELIQHKRSRKEGNDRERAKKRGEPVPPPRKTGCPPRKHLEAVAA